MNNAEMIFDFINRKIKIYKQFKYMSIVFILCIVGCHRNDDHLQMFVRFMHLHQFR